MPSCNTSASSRPPTERGNRRSSGRIFRYFAKRDASVETIEERKMKNVKNSTGGRRRVLRFKHNGLSFSGGQPILITREFAGPR